MFFWNLLAHQLVMIFFCFFHIRLHCHRSLEYAYCNFGGSVTPPTHPLPKICPTKDEKLLYLYFPKQINLNLNYFYLHIQTHHIRYLSRIFLSYIKDLLQKKHVISIYICWWYQSSWVHFQISTWPVPARCDPFSVPNSRSSMGKRLADFIQ